MTHPDGRKERPSLPTETHDMRNILLALTAFLAFGSAVQAQTIAGQNVSPIGNWKPVATPQWAPGALYDRVTAVREGDTVTIWFRFVDVPGHVPAYMKAQTEAFPKGTQIDALMQLDCTAMRYKPMRVRISDAQGRVLGVETRDDGWQPLLARSRGAAVRGPICQAVR